MKLRTLQSALNAGELSQLLLGRMDVQRFRNGLELCRNALPLVGGGVTRRPGSWKCGVAAADDVLLFPFIRSTGGTLYGYILEFSDSVIRFYKSDRTRIDDAGAAYEVATPYSAADLPLLQYEMFENAMYLWHPAHAPRKLTRTADTDWTLASVAFSALPRFRPEGTDAITITPSALSGVATLTASAALFVAGHVGVTFQVNGGLFKVTAVTDSTHATATAIKRIQTPAAVLQIEQAVTLNISKAGMGYTATIVIEFRTQRTYSSATLMLTTEQDIPEDEAGLTFSLSQTLDTSAGNEIYNDVVTVEIDPALLTGDKAPVIKGRGLPIDTTVATAFTTIATITPAPLPAGVTSSTVQTQSYVTGLEADTDWEEDSWSNVRGWPAAGTFHEQRMICAGTDSQPTSVWGSKIGDFLDFNTGTVDDESFAYTIAAAQSGVRQVATGDKLRVFTGNRELAMHGDGAALTSTNVQVQHISSNGCSVAVRPVLRGQELYFVGVSGLNLYSMQYSLERDNMVTPDMADLAAHFTRDGGGVVDMAFSRDPVPALWAVTAAGNLLSLTIDPNQDVLAWAKHYTSEILPEVAAPGDDTTIYKSVAVVPNAAGINTVWTAVARLVDGDMVTFIEALDPELHTDCTVYAAAGNSQVTGLDDIEGKTVDIIADGFVLPQQVVANGAVNIGFELEIGAHAGLHYKSLAKDLPPYVEGGALANASVHKAHILLHKSKGAQINGNEIPFTGDEDNVLDAPLQEFSGWKNVNTVPGWSLDGSTGQVTIEQDLPLPWTVLAIAKEIAIHG